MEKPDLEPYRALAEAGPLAVAEEAKRRGLSNVQSSRLVMEPCRVSVVEAKEAVTRAQYGIDLSTYQETYLLPSFQDSIDTLKADEDST